MKYRMDSEEKPIVSLCSDTENSWQNTSFSLSLAKATLGHTKRCDNFCTLSMEGFFGQQVNILHSLSGSPVVVSSEGLLSIDESADDGWSFQFEGEGHLVIIKAVKAEQWRWVWWDDADFTNGLSITDKKYNATEFKMKPSDHQFELIVDITEDYVVPNEACPYSLAFLLGG